MTHTAAQPIIVFSHGQDGEPWGGKIVAMAEVARALGYRVESIDYRGMADPQARVDKLLAFGKTLNTPPVLVGSSMGGHVATAVSRELNARGLFLLAPAFYMKGYEQFTPKPAPCPIHIVHGWRDDIVPVDNSIRYAREYRATLTVVDDEHRLAASIGDITHYLRLFLNRLTA
jgi:pimeloyl-ACP methyl ester carboxylesterase